MLKFSFCRIGKNLVSILLCLVLANQISGQTSNNLTIENNKSCEEILREKTKSGDAIIWYLFHCGYAIKTESKLLIFDYVRQHWDMQSEPEVRSLANGWINPEEIKELDVYVFVSHSHWDHFDKSIFGWADTMSNVTYFYGWDQIEGLMGNNLSAPRKSFKNDKIEIHTINSHHSGVPEASYLVKTDGLVIYHGGDYKGNVSDDYDYLSTKSEHVDIVMINDHCGEVVMKFLEKFEPKVVFPGHNGGKEEKLGDIEECCKNEGLPCKVINPRSRGDMYRYSGL